MLPDLFVKHPKFDVSIAQNIRVWSSTTFNLLFIYIVYMHNVN
jgi:hypothetical protein